MYTVLNGNFVFDLHVIFQEHNPGIKRPACMGTKGLSAQCI